MGNFKNFAYSTLATPPVGTGGLSLVVATGEGSKFPTVPFNAVIWPTAVLPTSSNAEIVRVTALASDTFTIVRAQESTSARTWTANAQIAQSVTQRVLDELEGGVINFKSYGAVGDGVTNDTTAVQAALTACPARGTVDGAGLTYVINTTLTIGVDYAKVRNAKFLALAGAQFEYMLSATSRTGVVIEDVEFDANHANRSTGQTVRFMGGGLITCTDSGFVRCTARNTLGYASIPAVGFVVSGGTRCWFESCRMVDCGTVALASDGIFASGTMILIRGCTAYRCADTGFVLESCNASGIIGCTAIECAAGGAISNSTGVTKAGNYVDGLSIYNWTTANTGGFFLGALSTGDLLDTRVDGLVMHADGVSYGLGPAIGVNDTGTGRTKRCTIAAPHIRGASTQGILVTAGTPDSGTQVDITDPQISGTLASCIQFDTGSSHTVQGGRLRAGTYGVTAQNAATVEVRDVRIETPTSNGVYANNTSVVTCHNVRITGVEPFFSGASATITVVGATGAQATPTEAVVVSGVDSRNYDSLTVTLTAARLVGAPLYPTTGRRLVFTFVQNGTGGWNVTWHAVFKVTWSNTGNTAALRSSVAFVYDGVNWNADSAQAPWV